jgi:hypothetical protein
MPKNFYSAVYVYVPGNAPGKRVGLAKFNESGYYQSDFDNPTATDEQAEELVNYLNNRLGVSPEIAEAALAGSMFGWKVPAAQAAVEYFKAGIAAE